MNWFYAQNGQQLGPVPESEISRLLVSGVISDTTLVWGEGMASWAPLGSLGRFSGSPPEPIAVAAAVAPVAPVASPSPAWSAPVVSSGPTYGGYQAPQTTRASHSMSFHGNGGEFFRIWIVNMVLTILTLGIYAAWAKVRTNRYFYGHTKLAGHHFDYLANPIAILKGNIIMALGALAYFASGAISPIATVVVVLVFFLVSPWLIQRALRFRANNTSYRNIRFQFHGTVGGAYWSYFWMTFLTILTVGLLSPYQMWRIQSYIFGNLGIGKSRFTLRTGPGSFYMVYLKLFGLFTLLAVVVALFLPLISNVFDFKGLQKSATEGSGMAESSVIVTMVVGGILYIVGLVTVSQYVAVRLRNLTINGIASEDDSLQLRSTVKVRQMVGLHLTNFLLLFVTIGFAYPWVKVRLARYRAENTAVESTPGTLDRLAADASQASSALGDAAADVFDMDIGI